MEITTSFCLLEMPNRTKMEVAIIGAPNITQIKSLCGKYQYPNRMENDANNIDTRNTESTNNIMSCLLIRDRLISLLNKRRK